MLLSAAGHPARYPDRRGFTSYRPAAYACETPFGQDRPASTLAGIRDVDLCNLLRRARGDDRAAVFATFWAPDR